MLLSYERCGQGPPVMLLHGLLGSSLNLSGVARALCDRFQVFNVNQRNHGASFHSDGMTYEQIVQDLVDLMDALGIGSAAVVGHSMGGKSAMQLALSHPERVSCLVVADMGPRKYKERWDHLIHSMLSVDLESVRRMGDVDARLAPSIPDTSLRWFLLQNLASDDAGRYFWKANLKAIASSQAAFSAAVSGPPFRRPCLFVTGAESPYVTQADIEAIQRLFPCARVATLSGAGHWVHIEARNRFNKLVSRFLAENCSGIVPPEK
jgi:esterase